MTWRPISTAPRDGTRMLLRSDSQRSRYNIVVGRWNDKFKEWQSDPGAWPMRPELWFDLNDLPTQGMD